MIPKIIHYCWFGRNDLPAEYQQYINGWKDFHPGWEIRKWDEENLPAHIPYLDKAAQNGKWANISNLVRFYALSKFGGIYLDTDIKIVKPLDQLLKNNCFLGFETEPDAEGKFWINNAVLGAVPDHPFVNYCLEQIQERYDGTEEANLSAPVMVTNILSEKWGLKKYGLQKLKDIQLYPVNYFYPVRGYESFKAKQEDADYPKETFTVHAWGRSWYSRDMFIKDIEVLQEYSTDLSQAVKNNEATIADLTRREDELRVFLEEKEREISKLTADNNAFQAQNLDTSILITEYIKELKNSYGEQIAAISGLSKELSHHDQNSLATKEIVARATRLYVDKLDSLEKSLLLMADEQKRYLEKELLKEELASKNIQNVISRLDSLEQHTIQYLEESLAKVNQKLHATELQQQAGAKELAKLHLSFSNTQHALQGIQELIATQTGSIHELHARITMIEKENSIQRAGLEQQQLAEAARMDSLEGAIRALNDQVAEMNASVNSKDAKIETLVNDIRYYQQRIAFYEKTYENQGLYRIIINHLRNNSKKGNRTNAIQQSPQ